MVRPLAIGLRVWGIWRYRVGDTDRVRGENLFLSRTAARLWCSRTCNVSKLKAGLRCPEGERSVSGALSELAKMQTKAKVVFLPGLPTDVDIRSCYTKRSLPSDCISVVKSNWAGDEEVLATSWRNAVFLDSLPWFCYRGSCPSFVGTVPMKMDLSHMSAEYALRIAPVVRESLRQEGIIKLTSG